MTWTKLGDEFSDEARDLTDAEYRTHVEALNWSNRRLLDLHVPKRDMPRFTESADAPGAVDGLVVKGWWADCGDVWNIGLRFPEWQLERTVVEKRRDANALRVRRHRMHTAGDHSICLADRCEHVMHYETHYDMRDPGRVGSGATHPPDPPGQNQDQDQGQDHPSPSPKPGDDNGSIPPADDDQQNPDEVQLQSPTAGGNAREDGRPDPSASSNGDLPRGRHTRPAEAGAAP